MFDDETLVELLDIAEDIWLVVVNVDDSLLVDEPVEVWDSVLEEEAPLDAVEDTEDVWLVVLVDVGDVVLCEEDAVELLVVDDDELATTTLASEMAFSTEESTHEVEVLVTPAKEFANT